MNPPFCYLFICLVLNLWQFSVRLIQSSTSLSCVTHRLTRWIHSDRPFRTFFYLLYVYGSGPSRYRLLGWEVSRQVREPERNLDQLTPRDSKDCSYPPSSPPADSRLSTGLHRERKNFLNQWLGNSIKLITKRTSSLWELPFYYKVEDQNIYVYKNHPLDEWVKF